MFKQTHLSDYFKNMSNKSSVSLNKSSEKVKFKLPHKLSLVSSDSEDDFEVSKVKTKNVTKRKQVVATKATKVVENDENKQEKVPKKRGRPRRETSEASPPKRTRKPTTKETKRSKSNVTNKTVTMRLNSPEKKLEVPKCNKNAPIERNEAKRIEIKSVTMQLNSPKKTLSGTPSCSKGLSSLKALVSESSSCSKVSEGPGCSKALASETSSSLKVSEGPSCSKAVASETSGSLKVSEGPSCSKAVASVTSSSLKVSEGLSCSKALASEGPHLKAFASEGSSCLKPLAFAQSALDRPCSQESDLSLSKLSEEFITQSTQEDLEDVPDYIVTNTTLNVSQYSATTEEYDTDLETIANASLTSTERTKKSQISRDIFGAKSEAQTETSLAQLITNVIDKEQKLILNKISQDETVTMITVQKVPLSDLKIGKSPSRSPKKNEPNQPYIDLNINTPRQRYSEENHQRLVANVEKIGKWVLDHFKKLLNPEGVALFNDLINLNDLNYQAFCLRLYTRQTKWHVYQSIYDTLKMPDDPNEREEMLKFLLKKKFVTTDYSQEDIPTLLNYLNNFQLKQICSATKLRKTPSKKDGMITALVKSANTQMTLSPLKSSQQILRDRVSDKLGTCVMLSPNLRKILDQVHTLFTLANPDLETPNDIYKLLNEIHFKKVLYPRFEVDNVTIFNNADDLEQYIKARVFRKEFGEEMLNKESKDKCLLMCEKANELFQSALNDEHRKELDLKKPLFLRRYSSAWVYCSILSSGALNLSKCNPNLICSWLNRLLAQKVYCPNKRGKWYAQLALVQQAHLKNIPAAIDAIVTGITDTLVDEISKYELVIRGGKIKKGKVTEELYERLQNVLFLINDKFPSRIFQANIVHDNVPGRKKSFIRNTSEGREYGSVEETAISFYLEENVYTQGIHCEGSLLMVLFYLLFWDIIYNLHVQNTFISNIQRYPLDMYSGEFYKNRKSEIDARLFEIEEIWSLEDISEFVTNILNQHAAEFDILITLDLKDSDFWINVIQCIGKKVLSAVCKRFVKNFSINRAGLPDLFLWNIDKKKCCFVEVKSEKDRLSTKQILWLNYLQSVGAKVELCFMQDIGSRSARKFSVQTNNEDFD